MSYTIYLDGMSKSPLTSSDQGETITNPNPNLTRLTRGYSHLTASQLSFVTQLTRHITSHNTGYRIAGFCSTGYRNVGGF